MQLNQHSIVVDSAWIGKSAIRTTKATAMIVTIARGKSSMQSSRRHSIGAPHDFMRALRVGLATGNRLRRDDVASRDPDERMRFNKPSRNSLERGPMRVAFRCRG